MASAPRPKIPDKGYLGKHLGPLLRWIVLRCYEPGDGSISVLQNENGGLIFANGGTAASLEHPFRVTGFLDAGTQKVRVSPGVISFILPTNVSATFAVAAGTSYMNLDVSTNGRNVTSAALNLSASAPTAVAPSSGQAPATLSVCLALITFDSGTGAIAIYQIQRYNIAATPEVAFTQSIVPASPGEEPFIRWYGWDIASI